MEKVKKTLKYEEGKSRKGRNRNRREKFAKEKNKNIAGGGEGA